MNIHDVLDKAKSLRICVVGDLITDRYIFGDVNRVSPEAPVVVVKMSSVRSNPGGAGNVVENLNGLGVQTSFFHQPDVPTKTRVMSGAHHLIRIDEENDPTWLAWDDIDIGLGYGIQHKKYDCVIISDYGKGCVSKEVAQQVIKRCAIYGIPVVVDTKTQHDIFTSATLIKCNLSEWHGFASRRLDFSGPAHFLTVSDIEHLVITNGARGIRYHDQNFGANQISGIKTEISDSCGAGDTVTAILGLMTALRYGIDDACRLANIAAAEVCRHAGVKPITKDALIRMFNEEENGL